MKLSTHAATSAMISAIHALKSRAGMDDDTYRDLLEREAGCRSAKQLTVIEAGRVIDRLRDAAGDRRPVGAVAGLDASPVARKLQALWITGYNLGLIHDRTDRAMLSFLERQTGVSHTRFLAHPSEATAAIEALKSWLRRGGVEWPPEKQRGDADILDVKRAVIEAQWRRLGELDDAFGRHHRDLTAYASKVARCQAFEEFESYHYDEVQKALGNRIRAALAAAARRIVQ